MSEQRVPLPGSLPGYLLGVFRPGSPPHGPAAGQAGGRTAPSLPRHTGNTGVLHDLPVTAASPCAAFLVAVSMPQRRAARPPARPSPRGTGTGSSSWPGRPSSPPRTSRTRFSRWPAVLRQIRTSEGRYPPGSAPAA